ncbi:ABC transporter ATP-binding protein [uncultured Dokdonia sp.]|uniref:ABC transporter ATP-binding protein n=1 Tax=uncultured Dokdonia sp. TaxID=575653 RepID=UPI0026310EE3|nr:ABC transporter ATP-binding protein [uncultured Dokdonia sp.]
MEDHIILKASNISKQYRLGLVGTGTLSHDINRLWHKIRGKKDPYLKIGAENDRALQSKSDYVWALKDINFEVKRGEILGIIGKNGAGKSTLLKILSRVTSPTTGSIKTRGRIASLLEVGTGMHPELTGRENIYLNGAILGMTKVEISSKIDEIVDFSGCKMYIDTPVKRYSSGMRVRLGFAVAAFLEPDILVIDEVLAVGDAEFQKKAIGKMQDISQSGGRTVLFVSHNMAAVQNLCNRVLILDKGKIVNNDGDPAIIGVEKYLSLSKRSSEIKALDPNFDIKLHQKSVYHFDENFTIDLCANSLLSTSKNAYIDIAVVNKLEEFVLHYRMDVNCNPMILYPGTNKFTIQIENPRLVMGEYTIIAYVYDKVKNVLLWVENTLPFQIVDVNSDSINTTTVKSQIIPNVSISRIDSI